MNINGTPVNEAVNNPAVNIRSEEVEDILSRSPDWLMRSGSMVLLAMIVLLLLISSFVQYPDVLTAKVTLTADHPPVDVVAQTTGYLTLFAKDQQYVQKGEYIGYVNNNVNVPKVFALKLSIDSVKKAFPGIENACFGERDSLGGLQSYYESFMRAVQNYQFARRQKQNRQRAVPVSAELASQYSLSTQQKDQNQIMQKELLLIRQAYERDSTLYAQKVISKAELDIRQGQYLEKERAYRNAQSSIINNEIQKDQLRSRLTDLWLNEQNETKDLLIHVEQAMNELLVQLTSWEMTYMLKAPIEGRLVFINYWSTNQFVKTGEEILTIVPESQHYVARAKLPMAASGKIQEGQAVNIKVDTHPYQEFGMLEGIISKISLIPKEDHYSVVISLPKNNYTSYNKKIQLKQNITGNADIITNKRSILERLLNSLRHN